MFTLFNVIRPDGRIARQCTSREHAEREIQWWVASGNEGPFRVEPTERSSENRFGWGRPSRTGGVWSPAKIQEFREMYERGEPVDYIADYFDTNIACVCKRARQLGFGYRIDDPRNFEKHNGRWTEREEQLINFMYDEGMSIREIAANVPRGKSAIEERLRNTASELSERSKFGRFIARPGSGNRAISPTLEERPFEDS